MKYILLVSVVFLVGLGIIQAKKEREIFNPILLFSAPILISIIVNLVFYDQRYAIDYYTYFVYFASMMALSLGLFIGRYTKFQIRMPNNDVANINTAKLFWVIMIFASIFAIIQIYKGYTSDIYGTGIKYLFNNVRYYTSYISGNNFLSKYGIVFADVLMIYYLYTYCILGEQDKKNKKSMIFAIFFYCLFTATQFNRTNLLYLCLIFAFFIVKKKRKKFALFKKQTKIIVLILIVAFLLMNFIGQKTGKGQMGEFNEPWWVYYFGSEFYWLQKLVINSGIRTNGYASLGAFGRFLGAVGVISESGYSDFRNIAIQYGNPVCSFVGGSYLDFGIAGLVVIIIYGFLIGYMYRQHLNRGKIWTMFYSTCVYQCVISFYGFQLGLSSQLYAMILLFILCKYNSGNNSLY